MGAMIEVLWYKLDVCSNYYPEQKDSINKAKRDVSVTYPKFYMALSNSGAEVAKESGQSSIYANRMEDPVFSARSCRDGIGMLNLTLSNEEWKNSFTCWK